MEQLDLATPETKPTNTHYRVERLTLDWPGQLIYIQLLGANGEAKSHVYTEAEAAALMIALNKANLSVKSLQKRIIEKLVADGVLVGAITGTPD